MGRSRVLDGAPAEPAGLVVDMFAAARGCGRLLDASKRPTAPLTSNVASRAEAPPPPPAAGATRRRAGLLEVVARSQPATVGIVRSVRAPFSPRGAPRGGGPAPRTAAAATGRRPDAARDSPEGRRTRAWPSVTPLAS